MPRHALLNPSSVVAIAFLLGSAAPAQPTRPAEGDELSKNDSKWLEQEVAAFITAEEIAIFKDLQSEDRKLFKDLFWARRDPNPLTPDNEFREEYKRRVKAADGNVRTPGQKGSLTDMGRVFMLLGGPSSTSRGLREYEADPFSDDSTVENHPQQLAWEYDPNPSLGMPDGLTVVFRISDKLGAGQRGGYRLVRSEEVEEILERVKDRYVMNRAITYRKDSNGRLLDPSYEFDPNSPASKLLQEMLETKVDNPAIPFEATSSFFQAEAGTIYVPTLFEIQAESLTWKEDIAEATLFGAVQNAEGQTLYTFEQPFELTRRENGIARYEMPILVAPGEYTFHLGILDDASDKVGTKAFPVVVPSFGDDVALSSVLVYGEAREDLDTPGSPGHAFQFGPTHMSVMTGDTLIFETSDSLGIFYFVYGYGIDPETGPSLTEQYIFFKDGKRLTQTAVEPLQANDEHAFGNAVIALSMFGPGSYKVEIRMTDEVKEETLTEEFEFVLKGESE